MSQEPNPDIECLVEAPDVDVMRRVADALRAEEIGGPPIPFEPAETPASALRRRGGGLREAS